jgi:flagella basal body P-ring formation protein FlgA
LIEKRIKRHGDSFLSIWPKKTVVATTTLQSGKPILTTDIATAEYVLTAKSTIVVGQVVTEDMVERSLEPEGTYGPAPLRQTSEIIGLEATRTIRAGSRLGVNDLIAADLIRKNETVRLVITRGALKITVETIALENAKISEQVLLRNPDSGREIRGIVTGRNEARGL